MTGLLLQEIQFEGVTVRVGDVIRTVHGINGTVQEIEPNYTNTRYTKLRVQVGDIGAFPVFIYRIMEVTHDIQG